MGTNFVFNLQVHNFIHYPGISSARPQRSAL